jgi:hypothetical protein
MKTNTDRIRALNDELRRSLPNQSAFITAGVAALGAEFVERMVRTVAAFDDFHHGVDPYSEHDFGAVEIDGHELFFKIDYYDPTLTYHSDDPANPAITQRVITLMLASEY